MFNNKIVAAAGAFLLAWLGTKLWFAPPRDAVGVVVMVVKGLTFATLVYFGVAWLRDKLTARQGA